MSDECRALRKATLLPHSTYDVRKDETLHRQRTNTKHLDGAKKQTSEGVKTLDKAMQRFRLRQAERTQGEKALDGDGDTQ